MNVRTVNYKAPLPSKIYSNLFNLLTTHFSLLLNKSLFQRPPLSPILGYFLSQSLPTFSNHLDSIFIFWNVIQIAFRCNRHNMMCGYVSTKCSLGAQETKHNVKSIIVNASYCLGHSKSFEVSRSPFVTVTSAGDNLWRNLRKLAQRNPLRPAVAFILKSMANNNVAIFNFWSIDLRHVAQRGVITEAVILFMSFRNIYFGFSYISIVYIFIFI